MIYVALLRGINVGGNSKVEMKLLKEVFEKAGHTSVSSYINSGNIIFKAEGKDKEALEKKLEEAIELKFGFHVKVLVKDLNEIKAIAKSLPDSWVNDSKEKCDVMFLWESVDKKDTLKDLVIKPGVDEVRYTKGAILWSVKRENVTKSGISRLIGTPLYKQMTIRNCNTTRKLYQIMSGLE